jgi:hypothetical protein
VKAITMQIDPANLVLCASVSPGWPTRSPASWPSTAFHGRS